LQLWPVSLPAFSLNLGLGKKKKSERLYYEHIVSRLVNALRFVPPAILTALIVPAVLIPNGSDFRFTYTNAYLVGALIAFGVGWFSKDLLLTILLGLIAFWGWRWILATWLV
jgi:branched-subunit amino acid transport protein